MSREYRPPRLVLTPRAWLKWQFLCHAGPTEIGAFGLSQERSPLVVEDLLVVKQVTTAASVAFDDVAVADLFDAMADRGISPRCFARIWLHTHPGASVTPSGVDEATFRRVFGGCDWAVMGILGRAGRTEVRLRFNAGPGGDVSIPTAVEWSLWPDYALSSQLMDDLVQWQTEFDTCVEPVPVQTRSDPKTQTRKPCASGLGSGLMDPDNRFPTRDPHDFN